MLLIFIPLLLPSFLFLQTQSKISETEFAALKDFYNSTNGGSWKNNRNWNFDAANISANDICPFHIPYGLTCDTLDTHISTLTLINNSLNGTIPDSIGNLEYLTNFYIESETKLVGSIPQTFFDIKSLKEITLYGVSIVLDLNSKLCLLLDLESITTGEISDVTGSIPQCIGNLTKLFWFLIQENDYSNSQLNGTIPASFFTLPLLDTVSMSQ